MRTEPSTALALVVEGKIEPADPLALRDHVVERSKYDALEAMALETRRAYLREFTAFMTWCRGERRSHLPATPQTVAEYVHALEAQQRAAAGIDLALAAISRIHAMAGYPSPRHAQAVKDARAAVRRRIRTKQRRATPLLLDALRAALATLPETPIGVRDRALLVLGWAGGLRRSEIVGLNLGNIRIVPQGIEVFLERSKTDQEGEGQDVDIYRGARADTCPVRTLEAWLTIRGAGPGPLFVGFDGLRRLTMRRMSGSTVGKLVKRIAAAAGLDADAFSAHSLRAGFVTQAFRAGADPSSIKAQTRHRSYEMLDVYRRDATRWERANASKGIGL